MSVDPFEAVTPDYVEPVQLSFFLELDGFEGPIDVLLSLARDQKVDLRQISILHLAEQYLSFVREARELNLELAADYLVMAAWLAYLKSRLLLPAEENDDDEPSPEQLAEALRFQLQRLQSMQTVGTQLMARARLGVDVFGRGAPEMLRPATRSIYDMTLYELLRAYADHRIRADSQTLKIVATELYSVEVAVARLRRMMGTVPGWRTLFSFMPVGLRQGLLTRSAMASTFAASLELVKEGAMELRQDEAFGAIYLKAKETGE